MLNQWLDSISHADAADWITVAGYLVASYLCARARRVASLRAAERERQFWSATTGLLLFFAVNELLDLQTLLTALGRSQAKAHGWYEQRKTGQLIFIIALTGATVLLGAAGVWLTRNLHRAVRLAVGGLGFIALFVLVRAASFHHADALLGSGWRFFNWGSVQEIAGVLIVAASAEIYCRDARSRNGG